MSVALADVILVRLKYYGRQERFFENQVCMSGSVYFVWAPLQNLTVEMCNYIPSGVCCRPDHGSQRDLLKPTAVVIYPSHGWHNLLFYNNQEAPESDVQEKPVFQGSDLALRGLSLLSMSAKMTIKFTGST